MNTFYSLTFLYLVLLMLAFLVERIMEVVVASYKYMEWRLKAERFWNRRARKLLRKFESKSKSKLLTQTLLITDIGRMVRVYTESEMGYRPGKVVIISGRAVRQVVLTVASRLAASLIGFGLCVWAGIDVFSIVRLAVGEDAVSNLWFFRSANTTIWHYLITGILVGMGSEPVHHIIVRLESRREAMTERARLNEAIASATNQQNS